VAAYDYQFTGNKAQITKLLEEQVSNEVLKNSGKNLIEIMGRGPQTLIISGIADSDYLNVSISLVEPKLESGNDFADIVDEKTGEVNRVFFLAI